MGKKILLADDSITIQKVIELTFSDEDFDVVTVGNGRLALERLADVRPDIVLCDIIMPEKDGYEVCEQIKSNPAWSHVPVLLLTGAFEPFDQDRAARAGYDGSLAKPFEPETLIAKVKELLARAPKTPSAPVGPVAAPPPRPMAAAPVSATPAPSFMVPPPTPSGPVVISRSAPPIGAPPAGPSSSFIPEEPFVAGEPELAPGAPGLAEAERQSLAMPAGRGTPAAFPSPEDDASTVMFHSADLPWAPGRGPSAGATAPVPQPSRPTPVARPVFEPEPELEEPERAPEVVDDAPAFEAVLEEDLEFGDAGYEPEPEPGPTASSHEPVFAPETAAPLASGPAPESTTGAFAALVRDQFVMPTQEPPAEPRYPEPETAPELKPETVRVERESVSRPAMAPLSPEAAAELGPEEEGVEPLESFEPEVPSSHYPTPADETFEEEDLSSPGPEPASVPAAPPVPLPVAPAPLVRVAPPAPVAPPVAVAPPAPVAPPFVSAPPVAPAPAPATSFADVAPAEPAATPSQSAGVAVPVDMVEKIAQRVIAQISEKAVREIAWEVIPDLAEAIIKQEIARLKAELAKL